jgi:transketolase
MRTAFIKQLIEEAKTNDKIFLLIGDLGYNVVTPFAEAYPDRFINVGICEQNMVGIASGLAMNGYNVYLYSIGNFPTLRCIEQIRNDVCYYNGNVKVVSVGAGFAYGSSGVSHHATEDIGMMRTLPNMVICSPSDPSEAKAITHISAQYNGCMYIRLGKAGEKEIYSEPYPLKIGDIHCYQDNNSTSAVIASGSVMYYAINWIKENNIDTAVYSIPFVKPVNKDQLQKLASRHSNLIVMDEHQKSSGVASALLEQLSDLYTEGKIKQFPKVRRLEIDEQFIYIAGNQQYLREFTHITLQKSLFE